MIAAIPLFVVVQALSAPAPGPEPSQPQAIVQTVRKDGSGKVTTETRMVDADVTTVRAVTRGGKDVEVTAPGEKRVLIELRERPTHDRHKPGSRGEAARQRAQLARDLAGIDARLQSRVPAHVRRHFETLFSGVAATVDPAALDEIRRLPYVLAVHDDLEVRAQRAESVPMIGATTVATTYGVTGAGVSVAVIDTGIDYNHPDLGGCLGAGCKVQGGYDFVNDDADPDDDHGHGTHVAGIVAANGTVKGVAPGAKLLAYKVLDADGFGFNSDVIAGIEQAVLDGAKIANLSLGGPGGPADVLSQAVDNATAAGMLSVVAAGNDGPSYETINSPGVARTALTVGAVTKAGHMAWFSSRGYVSDGGSFMMKPEITAPGVSIRSTVPPAGSMGSSTGYTFADGTSMAAPHVAGSAALLLQWKGTQTPSELKRRLVASAAKGDEGPFSEGGGMVNLVSAFALRVLPSTTHVEFGVASTGVAQLQRTLSISNPTNTTETVSLSASALPEGATLSIVPASVVLQPGQSVQIALNLRVDTAVTPEPFDDLLAWSASLSMTSGGQTARMPVYFLRGSVLNLTFGEAPLLLVMRSPELGRNKSIQSPGTAFSVMLRAGTWDVMVVYNGPPHAHVVREQQILQGQLSLDLDRSEATRKVVVRAIDDAQQPLDPVGFKTRLMLALRQAAHSQDVDTVLLTEASTGDFRVTPLSHRYAVGVAGAGAHATEDRLFTYGWTGSGLSSDVILPAAGVPMRQLAQSAPRPAGTDTTWFAHELGFSARFNDVDAIAMGGSSIFPDRLDWTHHFQTSATPGLPLIQYQLPWVHGFDSHFNQTDTTMGAYLRHTGGTDIVVNRSPFFDLHDDSPPHSVLGPAVTRWDVDTPPYSLPMQLSVLPLGMVATGWSGPNWVTHTASRVWRVAGVDPSFTLYRNGALVGTRSLGDLFWGVPYTPGAHKLSATMPYRIGNTAGVSKTELSFDTVKADPNPPWMTAFRIEQNGVLTATPSAGAGTFVKFRVHDDIGVNGVMLDWRQHNATAWTALPFTPGTEYVAPFQLEGAIDLRLKITDTSGNVFHEEWVPAVITSAPVPPTPPGSIAATRSGAAISVTWGPSSSAAGIARYRVERLPGGQTFDTGGPVTTFLDTSVVPGNAYFYRVVAVDQNGTESAPTGYDVASLIAFQDEPLAAGTRIRGLHMGELRLAVDKVRNAAGLPPAWTNYGPATGVVRAADFLALRDLLNAARTAMGLPAVQFTTSVAAGAVIRGSHLQQLRDGVK